MPSLKTENLSSFGQLAVKLDEHFTELTRLSGQIERLDIYSEGGLEHAVKLLNEFAKHGEGIAGGIQGFSQALNEVRAQSEAAAKKVAERAQAIHQRKQEQNQLRNQLIEVENKVKTANAQLAGSRRAGNGEVTNEDRAQIKAELERVNEELKNFLAEVQAVRDAAGQAKFKAIEHEAKNLVDVLKASSRKIEKAVAEQ